MGFNIEDGTGKGNSAGVDRTNRLLVRNISESIFQNAAEEGQAFFIGSRITNITTDTELAVLYVKNEGDDALVLGNFLFMAESSTVAAPAFYQVSWYKNSEGMNNGTSFVPLNQNFGSSETLDGIFEFGNGTTSTKITTNLPVATLSYPTEVPQDIPANLVLEKGSELLITVTAPATNTSMNFYFGSRAIKYIEQY